MKKISILTPTTVARKAFWPWVRREVLMQMSPHIELEWIVCVDDPDAFYEFLKTWEDGRPVLDRPSVRVNYQPPHMASIGDKRRALVMPQPDSDLVAWFDDDDWHSQYYLFEAIHELSGLPKGFGLFLPGALYVDLETGCGEILRTHTRAPMPISFVGPPDLAALPFRQHYSHVTPVIDAKTGEDELWFRALPRERYAISPTREHRWAALAHPLSATYDQKRSWRYTLPPESVARELGDEWLESAYAISALRARLKLV